jgi:putative DNA primase/helicase
MKAVKVSKTRIPMKKTRLHLEREAERITPVPSDVEFKSTKDGVFAKVPSIGGWVKLSAPIKVLAEARDISNENWGRQLEWEDGEGKPHRYVFSAAELVGPSGKVCGRLARGGLPYITNDTRLRKLLCRYLSDTVVDRRVRLAHRTGWQGGSYVTPHAIFSPEAEEELIFQTNAQAARWAVSGSLEKWRDGVAKLCPGNSRLVFFISCALAGPLLLLAGIDSLLFHLHGLTSTGKTTALYGAGSVLGGGAPQGFVHTWRATGNAIEAIAESHNDATLLLDELGQVAPDDAENIVYMLSNGAGRSRLTSHISMRPSFTWRLVMLSTGEPTLAEHAGVAGKRVRQGADARLLNITADAGAGLGVFEDLHDFPSPAAFAQGIERNAKQYFGTAFRAFVAAVVSDREGIREKVHGFLERFRTEMVPGRSSGAVHRAADRFALVGAAGELATQMGITGWTQGEAWHAAERLFQEWLVTKHDVMVDVDTPIRRLRELFLHHPERFSLVENSDDEVPNLAGYLHNKPTAGESEFWLLPEVFQREICAGVSPQLVARELERRGHLRRQGEHFTAKVRVPDEKNPLRVYRVRESLLRDDAGPK